MKFVFKVLLFCAFPPGAVLYWIGRLFQKGIRVKTVCFSIFPLILFYITFSYYRHGYIPHTYFFRYLLARVENTGELYTFPLGEVSPGDWMTENGKFNPQHSLKYRVVLVMELRSTGRPQTADVLGAAGNMVEVTAGRLGREFFNKAADLNTVTPYWGCDGTILCYPLGELPLPQKTGHYKSEVSIHVSLKTAPSFSELNRCEVCVFPDLSE